MPIIEKLGKASQITIGTKDVKKSFALYEKMGFRAINQSLEPDPWIQLTDDSILVLLNQDGMEYMGLTYFEKGMKNKVQQMEDAGIPFIQKNEQYGSFQAIFATPDNFYISLIDYDAGDKGRNGRITLMDYPQDKWNEIEYPNPKCGIFGELCIPVKDIDASIAFWKNLGFSGDKLEGPYPWAIMTDDFNVVGLHQTKDFERPAITYFAKGMGEKIKTLRAEGLDSIEVFKGTGGDENNVVVTTPENQQFFLFNY